MATYINGTKLKKCNINSEKCKKIFVNGVKVWSGQETFTQSVTSGACGRDDSYGSFGTLEINLEAGETFTVDNITFDQKIYSNIDCDLYVNGEQVWDYNSTKGSYYTHNSGVIGTYTAAAGKTAIMLRIRGWRSSGSWDGTFYDTATITYTTGV